MTEILERRGADDVIIDAVDLHGLRHTVVILLAHAILVGEDVGLRHLARSLEARAGRRDDGVPRECAYVLVVIDGHLGGIVVIGAAAVEIAAQAVAGVLFVRDVGVEQLVDSPEILIATATAGEQHAPCVGGTGGKVEAGALVAEPDIA